VLIDLLPRAPNTNLIRQALAIASPDRVTGIMKAMATADDELAVELTWALARMGDAASSAALLQAIGLPNPAARKAAATTLGGLGTNEALSALKIVAVEDPHPEVRRICAVVLA
jgi:HEAT repeat protein